MRRFLNIIIFASLLFTAIFAAEGALAQVFTPRLPIYIVNGERMSEEQVRAIEPEDIVSNTMLPADEQTIEKYGPEASNGVIVISLRYDEAARFEVDGQQTNFSNYIAQQIKWGEMESVAQVIMRVSVNGEGVVSEKELLDSSDRRLLKRVRDAIENAPRWVPAKKDGKGIETQHLVKVIVPVGSQMPREWVIRVV